MSTKVEDLLGIGDSHFSIKCFVFVYQCFCHDCWFYWYMLNQSRCQPCS